MATDAEFAALIEACDHCIAYRGKISREENAQLMKDVRYTAMRPGELRHLRWDHIHLDDGVIIIPAHEQMNGTTAKTPEDRIIPVLEEGKAILRRRQEQHGHHARVFPNIMGKEWTDQLFSQRFARLRRRAKLDTPDDNGEMLVPYSLRHTRLTEVGTKEGWNFSNLQRFAGHTNPKMTKRYVHPGMYVSILAGGNAEIPAFRGPDASRTPSQNAIFPVFLRGAPPEWTRTQGSTT